MREREREEEENNVYMKKNRRRECVQEKEWRERGGRKRERRGGKGERWVTRGKKNDSGEKFSPSHIDGTT